MSKKLEFVALADGWVADQWRAKGSVVELTEAQAKYESVVRHTPDAIEEHMKVRAKAKAMADKDAKAKIDAETKAKAEVEARAKEAAEAKAKAEKDAKAKAHAAAKALEEAQAKADADAGNNVTDPKDTSGGK